MKKFISLLLVAALLLSVGCVSAFADSEGDNKIVGTLFFTTVSESDYYYVLREGVVYNDAIAGATYDPDSKTLTLSDFDHPELSLYAYNMGGDFKINVEGSCALGMIASPIWMSTDSIGLTLTGTGTLTLNENNENTRALSLNLFMGSCPISLTIEEGVTVDAYGENSIYVYGSTFTSADTSITADGKPIEGLQDEEIVYNQSDTERIAFLDQWDYQSDQGYRVRPKSDPETEDVYTAVTYNDGLSYSVRRYVYIASFEAYTRDYNFYTDSMTEEELLEDYTFDIENQPVNIRYFTEEDYNTRGSFGYMMTSTEYPEDTFVGVRYWNWYTDVTQEPDGVYIYRVNWDEDQQYYVEDTTFDHLSYEIAELGDHGFAFATQEIVKHQTIDVWSYDPGRKEYYLTSDNEVVVKDDDPDTCFIASPYWNSGDLEGDPVGYYVYEVYQDDQGEYWFFLDEQGYTTHIKHLSAEDFAKSDYHFIDEVVEETIPCHFLDDTYDPKYDTTEAVLLKKDGKDYAYNTWRSYSNGGTLEEKHSVYELTFNEEIGYYFAVGEPIEWNSTLDELENKGYQVVTADQKVVFYLNKSVETDNQDVYTDDEGNRYVYQYDLGVCRINEEDFFTIGEETYYSLIPCPELSVDDLHSTEKPVHTGAYRYWLSGEYHHQGTGSEPAEGFTLSGKVTSFVTTEEESSNYATTVELLQGESVVKTASYDTAAVFDYSFDGVEAGDYTLRVSKQNHVPRDYAVTVSGDTTQDAEIYALGDVDGDGEISNFDYGRVNSCAKGKSKITDAYLLKVADIDGDEEITNFDAGRINSMAKGKSSFWK